MICDCLRACVCHVHDDDDADADADAHDAHPCVRTRMHARVHSVLNQMVLRNEGKEINENTPCRVQPDDIPLFDFPFRHAIPHGAQERADPGPYDPVAIYGNMLHHNS